MLAAADVTADGRADLAVGAPGDEVGTVAHEGSVTLLPGASTGLTATGSQLWSPDSAGVPGTGSANAQFGAAIAMGDVNGDGHADLAIGSPRAASGAGDVTVLIGAQAGLTATGSQLLAAGTAGVPGSAVANHLFGSSLLTAKISSGYASLMIGAPGDSTSTGPAGEGTLTVLPGSAAGLTTSGSQRIGESDMLGSTGSGLIRKLQAALSGDAYGSALG